MEIIHYMCSTVDVVVQGVIRCNSFYRFHATLPLSANCNWHLTFLLNLYKNATLHSYETINSSVLLLISRCVT